MEKYLTTINKLVNEVMNNPSLLKTNAEKGNPEACFQMGMNYMLGINTEMDLGKSRDYFENQSLKESPEANRMLGLIAELEGNYRLAFEKYAKAAGVSTENIEIYLSGVNTERNNLRSNLEQLTLPSSVLNNVISTFFDDYLKKKSLNSLIKIAVATNDITLCIEVAKQMSDKDNCLSALMWLTKSGIDSKNPLYDKIKTKINERNSLQLPAILQIVEYKGSSLLEDTNLDSVFSEVNKKMNKISIPGMQIWESDVVKKIKKLKKERSRKLELKNRQKELQELKARKKKRNKIIQVILIISFLVFTLLLFSFPLPVFFFYTWCGIIVYLAYKLFIL